MKLINVNLKFEELIKRSIKLIIKILELFI